MPTIQAPVGGAKMVFVMKRVTTQTPHAEIKSQGSVTGVVTTRVEGCALVMHLNVSTLVRTNQVLNHVKLDFLDVHMVMSVSKVIRIVSS